MSGTSFFACCNTCAGFKSFFGDYLKDIDYLYIIKGGPGTGKSFFMKKIANYAEMRGYTINRILCSSDPDSLDGIIIKEKRIGFCDGTSPHLIDPDIPAVNSEILNFGQYIIKDKLQSDAEHIKDLHNNKKFLYKKVYYYLSLAEELRSAQRNEIIPYIDKDKIDRLARRLLSKQKASDEIGNCTRIQRSAFSMKGRKNIKINEEIDLCYKLIDPYEIKDILLNDIVEYSKEKGLSVNMSYNADNCDILSDIYILNTKMAFLSECEYYDKTIDLKKFVNIRSNSIKNLYKHLKVCRENIYTSALNIMREISSIHFELESYYSAAMSFDKIDSIADNFCKTL